MNTFPTPVGALRPVAIPLGDEDYVPWNALVILWNAGRLVK